MTIIKVQILNYREYEKEALYLKKKTIYFMKKP